MLHRASFVYLPFSCGCFQPLIFHRYWPRRSHQSHAEAPLSLWHGTLFLIFLDVCIPFLSSGSLSQSFPTKKKKKEKSLALPASFGPISVKFCVSKTIWVLFFLESNPILSAHQAGFRTARSTLDQMLYLAQSIRLINPSWAWGRFLPLSILLKLLLLSDTPIFLTSLFWLASLLALFDWLNLFFLIGTLAQFFKIAKVALFESVEVLYKDLF